VLHVCVKHLHRHPDELGWLNMERLIDLMGYDQMLIEQEQQAIENAKKGR